MTSHLKFKLKFKATLTLSEFISTSVKRPFIKPVVFITYNATCSNFLMHIIQPNIITIKITDKNKSVT